MIVTPFLFLISYGVIMILKDIKEELGLNKDFYKILRREVDKANKRIQRMNDFQKSVFASKGLIAEKISRTGDIYDKLRALSLAKQINDNSLSTAKGYAKFIKQIASNFSEGEIIGLTKKNQKKILRNKEKQIRYIIDNYNVETQSFLENSRLSYGSPVTDIIADEIDNFVILENQKKIDFSELTQVIKQKNELNALLSSMGY